MGHEGVQKPRTRPVVTVVGPFSEDRVDLARALLEKGVDVGLCAGPPGCELLREQDCPLIDTGHVTVMLPNDSTDRKVITGLSLCAQTSATCVVMEPSSVGVRGDTVHVRFSEMERVADFVSSVLNHPSSRR
jgi:hypothetical protein